MATQYLIVPAWEIQGRGNCKAILNKLRKFQTHSSRLNGTPLNGRDWIKVIEQHVAAYPAGEVVPHRYSLGCTAIALGK